MEKDNNLLHGKGENDVEWITVNGAHIPIEDGQTPQEAIKNHFTHKSKSKKKSLETQVDQVLKGTYKDTHITLCEDTPKVLQDLGIPNRPILMTAKHAYLAINSEGKFSGENDHYHDLGKELFAMIPKLLQSPAMVLQSNKNKDDVIAILNWYDKNKNILICPIRIGGYGKYNEISIQGNIVKSIYGKQNIDNYVNKNFSMNDILYAGHKKIRELRK